MFCKKCGKKLMDGARFCDFCGADMTSANAPAQTWKTSEHRTVYNNSPQQPDQKQTVRQWENVSTGGNTQKKKEFNWKPLAIGGGAAALVLCVGLGIFFSGVLDSPEIKVAKAMQKTVSAYGAGAEQMGLLAAQNRDAFSVDLAVELKEADDYDLELLEGVGDQSGVDYDAKGRQITVAQQLSYGSADLIHLYWDMDDSVVSIYSPELLGDNALGVDTATLGRDLAAMTGSGSAYDQVGFNFFDYSEQYQQLFQMDTEGAKTLLESIEVEKRGKDRIEVNGYGVECDEYRVVIPESALRKYFSWMAHGMGSLDLTDTVLDLMRAAGATEDDIMYIESDVRESMSYTELFNQLTEAVKVIGDVELDVYLKDGYLLCAHWEKDLNGDEMELGVYFGGGENYADDFSLMFQRNNGMLLLESTGNHTGASGRYTDNTTIGIYNYGDLAGEITSHMEYQPKEKYDNFYWTLDVDDDFSVEARGQLNGGSKSMDLQLEDVEFYQYGSQLANLQINCSIGDYQKTSTGATGARMLSDMSLDDVERIQWEIEENAENWAYDVIMQTPAIEDVLWALF